MSSQLSLFARLLELPEGFRYHPDVLDEEEEHTLVGEINRLPFKEFEFHGFSGKRRVVSFGWQYDFNHAKLREVTQFQPSFSPPARRPLIWLDLQRKTSKAVNILLSLQLKPFC